MSYQVKKTIVSIITGIFILAAYCIHVYGKHKSGTIAADDMKSWAWIILVFIGISIVAAIVIQIVFHILLSVSIAVQEKVRNGKCDDKEIERTIEIEMTTDEMDKLIELKSMRIGFFISGIGFVSGLVLMVLNYSPAVMLNVMFLSFNVGYLIEGFAQLYFYRRGVRNG